jgi:dTDP-N-acetylfucosamine:lipid II N-acetylfucosaminyltransferase
MNLHIVPDSKFVNAFCANLRELNALSNNRVIVSSRKKLKYVERDLSHAPLYSSKFELLCGDTSQYDAVYIHLFSPLMYRWVAQNSFKELNWIVWGVDLYNLPFIKFDFYEKLTRQQYSVTNRPLNEWLYLLKIWITNSRYRNQAYSKIDNVLTWMKTEYAFAKENIPSLRANHKFFFYENQSPYQKLDENQSPQTETNRSVPSIIVGNSGYPTNNHLDAIDYITRNNVKANLYLPVSYGDSRYITFLKKKLSNYSNGSIEFIDKYMGFDDYLKFLRGADAFVMNSVRPQGYGNVLMMLYLGKAIFMNERNISLPDLRTNGIKINDWSEMNSILGGNSVSDNKEAVINLLSHQRLIDTYRDLFS